MSRLRSKWRWIAGLVLLAAIGYSAVTVFGISNRRLKAALGKLKAGGAPITMAQLAPPRVPNDKNAALLYEQAVSFLPKNGDSLLIQDFLSPDKSVRALVSAEDVQRVVAGSAPAVKLLHDAAATPACRFPVNWEAGYEALFPHLKFVYASASLLAAKAILDAKRGDASAALKEITVILRMGDHISAEPYMMSQLIRFACQHRALRALNRVTETTPIPRSDARRLYEVLGNIDDMGPLTRALQGARCSGILAFDLIQQNPHFGLGPFPGTPKSLALEDLSARARFLASLYSFQADEALFLSLADESIRLSRHPYREVKGQLVALDRGFSSLHKYHRVFNQISHSSALLSLPGRDVAIALIGLAQHGLALEAYRQATGGYPASLAELRARVGWKLPEDPFSGKDFIYRRIGNGYLIYSIGPNMIDDGGQDWHSAPRAHYGSQRPDDVPWLITR